MTDIKCRFCGATPAESESIYEYDGFYQHRHTYQCIDYLKAQNEKLRSEVDRYDVICTGIRNELTDAKIPELTENRLYVVPLVARVKMLHSRVTDLKEDADNLANANERYSQLLGGRDEDGWELIETHRKLMEALK